MKALDEHILIVMFVLLLKGVHFLAFFKNSSEMVKLIVCNLRMYGACLYHMMSYHLM